LSELERRCQKFGHPQVGNWMARRVARPTALRITRVIAPWGISANAVTLAAWLIAFCGAAACCRGTPGGWLLGAGLLQIWYLLDHVDGQLARLRRTESLDGVALDYLMHHVVLMVVPLGLGLGLIWRGLDPTWMLLAIAWMLALLIGQLGADVRYKAFIQRLKRVRGELTVVGGAGGVPSPSEPMPRAWRPLVGWLAAKGCEIHVIMNTLAGVAIVQLLIGDASLWLGRGFVLVASAAAAARTGVVLRRLLGESRAEEEFARWYRPPAGSCLVYEEGWWVVVNASAAPLAQSRDAAGSISAAEN
jgi:phosphatidylglycerophosphate synthase